ncbi:MAG: dienelactone hydrolase family protein [Alphaproteobacteria bacterium]|nr:dienelactone hydrolase family protein [Alphaproteobacteria bacterium]
MKAISEAHPDADVHIYDADHGFNCNHRGSYNEAAAILARQRTMELYGQQVG